jgi:hypothetical protein
MEENISEIFAVQFKLKVNLIQNSAMVSLSV